jgi:uncharacterized membrane protein
MTRSGWTWWRWPLAGLNVLALALSAYLSWHALAGGSMIGCGGGSPCDEVLNSRWSSMAGVVPISGLALGAYLAMLVAIPCLGPTTAAPVRRLAWRAMLILAGAIAGSAVWFIIVQKWIIGAFCPYCMATHVTGLLLAALVIWQAPRQADGETTDDGLATASAVHHGAAEPVISRPRATGFVALGLAAAGLLAAGQVALAPAAVYRGGAAAGNASDLDPGAVPLVGSPDAPYVVDVLFDYQCPHCQRLHFLLGEVVRRYGGKLAFALCPAPLSPQCNAYVPREVRGFADSCALARVALAVWTAKRDAFADFDGWMFALDSGDLWRPRRLDAARARAIALTGQARFDAALSDPWIEQYLQASVRIYGNAGGNAVPKLVFGSRWVTPEANDADELIRILETGLALPPP